MALLSAHARLLLLCKVLAASSLCLQQMAISEVSHHGSTLSSCHGVQSMIVQSSRHDHVHTFLPRPHRGSLSGSVRVLGLDVLYVGVVDEVTSPVWCSALHLMRTRCAKGTGRIPACTLTHIRDTEANVSFGQSACSSLCLSRSNLNRIAIIQRDGIRQCIIIYSPLSQICVSGPE